MAEYFPEGDETGYKAWMREHQATGFVVNNFKSGDRLKIHKATCDSLKPPKIHTGKLCGFDESELIEGGKRQTGGKYRPKRCRQPGRNCFG